MVDNFEDRIRTIVEESVRKVLSEMAMKRSDYIQRVLSLLPQIAQNWCLCLYANSIDDVNYQQLKEHWSTELISYLENLEGIVLKNGDKLKATNYALIEAEDLDTNINNIVNKIKHKFKIEKIDDKDLIRLCAYSFQKELPTLSKIISNKADISASEYVDEFFY